ncbi:adenylate/guanylate cyclase domain-containing protein [Candidatus Albibeggiatoa sp. nov. NOAA]|uniref:adenylate/guanylate cyclase domain-containing protein n=1 Tax=Candidatus Albibeggiatoa sp. nov. NOAA TaxID=3162724 RepID=UPI0032FD9EC2|nr:adenylate/guanylate cyclase domain-containing protein [Thiotrichaceae bacterium]
MTTTTCQDLPQLIFQHQKTAYAITDTEYNIIQYGGDTHLFGDTLQQEATLFDVVPELYGCEDVIEEVARGELPEFDLDNLNRILPNGETRYVDLALMPYQTEEPHLLVLLVDKTEWTQTQQTLTQQRNELGLLKAKLDEVNERMEFIIQHYVPREVGKALMENRIAADLGGNVREVTALFADLRNYTSISEKCSPDEVIDLLHVCLEIAASAVEQEGGVVVNFMGDAIMAIFNAPNHQEDHAKRATKAGLIMQENMKQYLAENKDHVPPLYLGVGINTGQALVGNIGVQWHYQYTSVGDTINVASRICSQARPEEVLIGPNTYEYIKSQSQTKALPPMKFKGKSQEMVVYTVLGVED